MAYDRQRDYLYIIEPLVDVDKPVVHVWRLAE